MRSADELALRGGLHSARIVREPNCTLRPRKLYPRLGNFTAQNTQFCPGFPLKKTSSGPRMTLHYTISARQDVNGVRHNEDVILNRTYEGETEDEP
jgi:hypothetical protein